MLLQLLSILIIHSTPFDKVAQGSGPPKSKDTPLQLGQWKTIQVSQFYFVGNQAISTQQLSAVVSDYKNRIITESGLQEIQRRIERLYRGRGYPDVKVEISSQQSAGSLEIVIDEGKGSA